jgi:hypothetical protein
MKKNPKDSKILSKKKKKANAMVLKIKWRKQKQRERAQAQHWGGTVDHFTNQIQGPQMYEQKVWDISTSDP